MRRQYMSISSADDYQHLREEIRRSFQFVTELIKLCEVTGREINPYLCLEVSDLPDGRYSYVEQVRLNLNSRNGIIEIPSL